MKRIGQFAGQRAEGLVRVANGAPPPNFSDLFPVVLRLSEAHDEVALRVLQRAGVELAELVRIVIARLFSEEESVAVAMSGGVFRESWLVRDVFGSDVLQLRPQVVIQDQVVEAVAGALALARLASQKPNQNL